MTEVTVTGHEDLQGDQVSTSTEKDRILQLLRHESDRVRAFRADEWLWESKSLETTSRHETLVSAEIIAESEKAYLITQLDQENYEEVGADDPQTDWVPKSVVRVYKPGSKVENNGPQGFLGDYE